MLSFLVPLNSYNPINFETYASLAKPDSVELSQRSSSSLSISKDQIGNYYHLLDKSNINEIKVILRRILPSLLHRFNLFFKKESSLFTTSNARSSRLQGRLLFIGCFE